MSEQKILFIGGCKQSGKSSAANYLTGYLLRQVGVIKYFELDENGDLLININVQDPLTGEITEELGLLDLTRKDEEFGRSAAINIWPHIKIFSFSEYLKEIACVVFGLNREEINGTNEQKNKPSPIKWTDVYSLCPSLKPKKGSPARDEYMTNREFLQVLGTDICRKIKNSCWVESCCTNIILEDWPLSIVTDCRFFDEAEYSKKVGAKTIMLTRNPHNDTHSSETDYLLYQDWDSVIDNENMTQEEKGQELIKILQSWGWVN